MTVVAVVSDAYNRANSTTSLGSADTGQAWSAVTVGSVFGILSNQAYTPSGTPNQWIAVVESGKADCVVKVTTTTAADAGPCWRESDDNNYWLWTNSPSAGGKIFKKIGGSFTQVGTTQSNGTNGDVISVQLLGSALAVLRNGTTLISTSDAANSTATKHGLRINDTLARFDDFSVTAAVVPKVLAFAQAVRQAANY